MSSKADPIQPTPFERFREFTRKLITVPKTEIEKQQRAWRRGQLRKKRCKT